MKMCEIRKLNYSSPNGRKELLERGFYADRGLYHGIYVEQILIVGSAKENSSSRLIGLIVYARKPPWE